MSQTDILTQDIALDLQNITKNFGGIRALKNVNFQLKRGEVHALLGENGAGKSTLIKIITGVHQADGGKMLLSGEPVTVHSTIDARSKGIAAIYQELSLIESLTVAENIFLGNEPTLTPLKIYDRKTLYDESQAYLEKFGIDIDSRMKVCDLGMGQKRIVEIVKALAVNSSILLLDEPTTGMSKAEIDILFQIIATLKENNVTMIYISHYLDEVFHICDRATVLRDGENVITCDIDSVTPNELVKSMIGHDVVSSTHVPRDLSGKMPILELVDFKSDCMKEKVSLSVCESEIVGVTGIVGAGKSELAHSIFGNAKREFGEMYIHGKKVVLKSPHDTKRHHMAFVPEDRKKQGLFLDDSMSDNTVIANLKQIMNPFGLLSRKKKASLSNNMARSLQLSPPIPNMAAGHFSGGNQQKIVIAKWLTCNPELMIMDEPTRGIDVGAKNEIYSLIKGLAQEGKGVLVMSSEFDELIDLCDRILVLRKGKIVGELSGSEVNSEKLLSLSLGGETCV